MIDKDTFITIGVTFAFLLLFAPILVYSLIVASRLFSTRVEPKQKHFNDPPYHAFGMKSQKLTKDQERMIKEMMEQ